MASSSTRFQLPPFSSGLIDNFVYPRLERGKYVCSLFRLCSFIWHKYIRCMSMKMFEIRGGGNMVLKCEIKRKGFFGKLTSLS